MFYRSGWLRCDVFNSWESVSRLRVRFVLMRIWKVRLLVYRVGVFILVGAFKMCWWKVIGFMFRDVLLLLYYYTYIILYSSFTPIPVIYLPYSLIHSIPVGVYCSILISPRCLCSRRIPPTFDPACFIGVDGWGVWSLSYVYRFSI